MRSFDLVMMLHFYKMNGAGNDFVVIDNRELTYALSSEQIAWLCDRHRGVGADGLLAVEPAEGEADFKFRYYNADGGEAEMCGNGARCFARFASALMDDPPDELSFETVAGLLKARQVDEDIQIDMSEPVGLELNCAVEVDGLAGPVHAINTGVPHAVVFVDGLDQFDVVSAGRAIRQHAHFAPQGTNANFVEVRGPNHLAIRTYERGVEDETLACGTGMVACALIHHCVNGADTPISIDVRGGDTLEIGFERGADGVFREVTLTGPADFVFEGEIEI